MHLAVCANAFRPYWQKKSVATLIVKMPTADAIHAAEIGMPLLIILGKKKPLPPYSVFAFMFQDGLICVVESACVCRIVVPFKRTLPCGGHA